MTLDEAVEECNRWFAYLEREKAKTVALQDLASEARRGNISRKEIERRRKQKSYLQR